MNLFDDKSEDHKSKTDKSSSDSSEPLATRMRPKNISEFTGQDHLLGEGKLLRRMIKSGVIGSLIFYGPPSSGKTTLAHVISNEIDAKFKLFNAVLNGVKELREVVQKAKHQKQANGKRTILFVDEIHRWNKAQQDALLPHLESGIITLIGATTENPFYSLVSPLLSRCQLFELYPLTKNDVNVMLHRAIDDEDRGLGYLNLDVSDQAIDFLSEQAGGDIRNALNALEIAALSTPKNRSGVVQIDIDIAKESIQKRNIRYQKTGDEHYHYASAFIKSMRGSDVDAALYWMSSMIQGGEDPQFIFRRMLIFASEDVGLADPYAVTVIHALHESFQKTGMPEGLYHLSQGCIFLSLSPKSNSSSAIFDTMNYIEEHGIDSVPPHLKDKTANKLESSYLNVENASDDYKYPHQYPGHWVKQNYKPEKLIETTWYKKGTQGREKRLVKRLDELQNRT